MAGLAKLQGQAWWNGTAIWGTLAAGEFRLFDLTWLAAYPLAPELLTHAGLAHGAGLPGPDLGPACSGRSCWPWWC